MSEAGENLGSGLVCVALLATGILSATRAAACPPACHTATLSTWEVRQVPYVARVTRYDHCGRPYTAIGLPSGGQGAGGQNGHDL